MMMREIARHQKISEEEETRKTAKKRDGRRFWTVENVTIENIFVFVFLSSLKTLNFSLHKIFALALFEKKCTFLECFLCVRVRRFLSLCMCASELENVLWVNERCLRRRAKWFCRCVCCPPPPREDNNNFNNTEEFYEEEEDGSITRTGVATTMKTTTLMGIWRWWWWWWEKAPRHHHHHHHHRLTLLW